MANAKVGFNKGLSFSFFHSLPAEQCRQHSKSVMPVFWAAHRRKANICKAHCIDSQLYAPYRIRLLEWRLNNHSAIPCHGKLVWGTVRNISKPEKSEIRLFPLVIFALKTQRLGESQPRGYFLWLPALLPLFLLFSQKKLCFFKKTNIFAACLELIGQNECK